MIAFTNLLKEKRQSTFWGPVDDRLCLSAKTTGVTFDFHGYLIDEENDRGELADILISDLHNRSAVAVEVKFLSNWNFDKDILSASRRFKKLLESERISSFVHVLLITQSKLDAVRKSEDRVNSNWGRLLRTKLDYPLVLLTWEDVAGLCAGANGEKVRQFLTKHLKETRGTFRERARTLIGVQ